MLVRERYEGLQDLLLSAGGEGCHFLTLLSIAEEYHKCNVDLIDAIRACRLKGWIGPDFWVKNDGTPILEYLTNKKWTRKEVVNLPVIRDNDYTEAIYYNPNTGYRHYRRRYFDVKNNSITVRDGYIEKYYIYTVEE